MTGGPRRAAVLVAVALGLAIGAPIVGAPLGDLAGVGRPPAVRAAETDLTLVTDARYDVEPEEARLRVTLDVTATNRTKETRTRRFYFDHAFLAVPPGTTGFRISGDGRPRVRVAGRAKTHTTLRIDFGTRLYSGRSADFRLRFDVPDRGGAATRELRVGGALVAFPVWAYASDGASGSTVSVVLPKGYEITVERGELPQQATLADGRTVLRSGRIARPTRFYAYVVGVRPAAYAATTVETTVLGRPVSLSVRAWQDDAAWAERVGTLLRTGLPVLGEDIGLGWPAGAPGVFEESVSRSTDGYAGLFDPAEGRVEIAYYAPSFVVLHEAAHGWFNGSFLADRWANEAFASLYAVRAAAELDLKVAPAALTDELRAAAIPLNDWSATTEDDPQVEAYAYAASLELARAVLERAGPEGLAAVWASVRDGIGPYRLPARGDGSERLDGPPDWRGLLDLLEDRTGLAFDDLWREWVVRPDEAALLERRAEVRESYERTLRLAEGWALPGAIRDALRAWRFDEAEAMLADVRTVLAQREALEDSAARSGLRLPGTMRALFEGRGTLADASLRAAAEHEAIEGIRASEAARPVTPDPFQTLGLAGSEPEADLAEARRAFEAGDLEASTAAAADARATWEEAWAEGRARAILAVVLVAALLIVFSTLLGRLGLGGLLRGRRRSRADRGIV